jgi:hypothetical protein
VCLDHDALKRLKVVRLPEHMHLPGRSVQDVMNKAAGGYSRCSRHSFESYLDDGASAIQAASAFPFGGPAHGAHAPLNTMDLVRTPGGV